MQDVENQTRFSLEDAVLAWRQDCASRPGISFDDARELESDLRERVADLLKEGLSEKEAFGKAVRQVGSPSELAREFARENPLAVWRERLFWMVAAGFALSLWGFMTNGPFFWFVREFGVLLPLSWATWFTLAGHLPVLIVAVFLASGRLEKPVGRVHSFLQSRPRLALAGAGSLLAGALVRLFGPSALQPPAVSLMTALAFLLDVFAWPLTLLVIGVFLFRPQSAGKAASSRSSSPTVPAAVWRERVFWMAVGGLLVGFWQSASQFGITALFYTGDANRPYEVGPLMLISVYKVIQLSPLLVLGLFVGRRVRSGKAVTAGAPVQRRVLFVLIPAVVCAWFGLYMWSTYLWVPRGLSWHGGEIFLRYVTTCQWLWPAGLATLVLWPAPKESQRDQQLESATN